MRILVISNLYPPQVLGGYERSIADFARLLQHRGHTVEVLTSDMPEYYAEHQSSYREPEILRCVKLAGKWAQGKGGEWLSDEQVKQIFADNRKEIAARIDSFCPDVALVGNLDLLHTIPLQALLSANIPTVHYVMNSKPGYPPELTPKTPLYQYATCSNWVTESLQQAGFLAETAQTIYPGAIIEEFYQSELPVRDHLRIAYASLVMAYKGADVLIEALGILQVWGIPFSATIAGGNFNQEYVEALEQFVIDEGINNLVKFVGALSRRELSHMYKTHNVLVFPSRFQEPFGISQIEAMAAGLALVTSGTGGAREIVEDGQDGLLFESENAIDLADKLSYLAAEPNQWEAIARRGQQKAVTQFNQTNAVEELETLFQKLLHLKSSYC
ncbi:MAG: glycosyltransferase family 4 protein [Leptolyngbyaceae cyanobacterium bins.302]|nr:glycosyltransferase family 4 protein [Leptolyngbyaceae cyanobacterium bins.302]